MLFIQYSFAKFHSFEDRQKGDKNQNWYIIHMFPDLNCYCLSIEVG